jgi:hypothetical protein
MPQWRPNVGQTEAAPLSKADKLPGGRTQQFSGPNEQDGSVIFGQRNRSCLRHAFNQQTVDYKRFSIHAFEREPGLWRARITRRSGRPLIATGSIKLQAFVTTGDCVSPGEAMTRAMAAIDSGMFFRKTSRSTERFWRPRGNKPSR